MPQNWPSARQFTEAIQCPAVCFQSYELKNTLPAIDRLGMPLVTSGQFAFVYKLNSIHSQNSYAVRSFPISRIHRRESSLPAGDTRSYILSGSKDQHSIFTSMK